MLLAAFAAFVRGFCIPRQEDGNTELALCLFALLCWLMTPREKRGRRAALCFFWAGLAFALVWLFTSNTGYGAMTIGFAVAAVGGCRMIADFVRAIDRPRARTLAGGVAAVVLAVAAFMMLAELLLYVFRDGPVSWCNERIGQGPARGLYTMPARKEQYDQLYTLLTSEEMQQQDGPLFLSRFLPWGYLCTDRPCGAPGGWKMMMDDPQLKEYYREYPDRFPTTVLTLDEEVGWSIYSESGERKDGNNQNVKRSFLKDEMKKRGYTVAHTPCGTLYNKPQDKTALGHRQTAQNK